MVSDHYGEWDDGPRPDSLKDIPACEDLARLAVRCAFEAHREAQKIVGAPPWLLIAEANRARKAYNAANKAANMREGVSDSIPGTDDSKGRRARAVASIAELDSEMEAAAKQAQAAQEVWLNAMVRQLLQPASKQTKAPVTLETREPASAGTTPLAMNQIANCFADFHGWNVSTWKKSLGSPADWLAACRSARGTRGRGGFESTWWPLEIAAALIKQDAGDERLLRSRFRSSKPLQPWLEQFESNYPKQD